VSDDRTPVLVGVAQETLRDVEPSEAPSPPEWLEATVRAALADAGVGQRALSELDMLGMAPPVGWRTANPVRALCQRLGAHPRRELLLAIGGEMPLTFLDHAADQIRAGRARSVLIAGCHNLRTLRRARRQGVALDWRDEAGGAPELFGENRPGTNDDEVRHGLDRPSTVYPLLENALRARRGLEIETHAGRMGRLLSAFTRVAAANPHAWFPTERSAQEIVTPSATNRMVAFPYTKYMNAVMETDQVVAVWLLSAAAARAYGIPEDRWLHYRGGATAHERAWFVSERPDHADCPALREAVAGALSRAGVTLDQLDAFDFYSCFPVAVEMACEMLGLAEDDPRGLTVTGGLPYAGGPGNDYTLHALASMVERLREQPGVGLVTGNGWYLTKHSACVIASSPGEGAGAGRPPLPKPGPEPLRVRAAAQGEARVSAYTVLYGRDGAPTRGIVVGRLAGGEAFVANTPDAADALVAFAAEEQVGRSGRVRCVDGTNRFEPD
jgi:acetyl-CoA C-acetyltransferase